MSSKSTKLDRFLNFFLKNGKIKPLNTSIYQSKATVKEQRLDSNYGLEEDPCV